MQAKWLFGIGIIVAAIASLYFIIKLDFNYAVLAMVALLSMTNGVRAKSFRDQGMERESKWMRWMSILFGASFIVLLVYILT
jgi:threonine/homoserine/homoserine lactone efflux protein